MAVVAEAEEHEADNSAVEISSNVEATIR